MLGHIVSYSLKNLITKMLQIHLLLPRATTKQKITKNQHQETTNLTSEASIFVRFVDIRQMALVSRFMCYTKGLWLSVAV